MLTIKNLKKIIKYFNLFLICLFFLIYTKKILGDENKIIFKINNQAFTTLDYERRLEYLDFVGNNSELSKKMIIDDYISAMIFFEYYKNSNDNNNYNIKINEIYENIYSINKENNKQYKFKLNKEKILSNIKIDYIRKIILERILNSNIDSVNSKGNNEIDLLYNFRLEYLNISNKDYLKIKDELENLIEKNTDNLKLIFKKKNINYFYKEQEVNNINNIDLKIKNNIINNKKFSIILNNDTTSFIFIDKNFETFDGIIADIYSYRSTEELTKEDLLCKNLFNKSDNPNIVSKEYKFISLNNELKNNLVSVNDYVKFNNEDENIYIILCDIKFDVEKLSNLNLNKIINSEASNIEKEFINKYSKVFNLIELNGK